METNSHSRKTMKRNGKTNDVTAIHPSEHARGNGSIDRDTSKMAARNILRPLLLCLALTAQFGYTTTKRQCGRGGKTIKESFIHTVSLVYRIVVFVILIFTLGRSVAAIFFIDNKSTILLLVIYIAWTLQCVCNALLAFKTYHRKYGNLHRFFDFWDDKIVPSLSRASIDLPVDKVRRHQWFGVTFLMVYFVTNTVGTAIMASGIVSTDMEKLFAAPFTRSPAIFSFQIVTFAYLAVMWLSPMLYVISVCLLLKSVLKAFVESLEQSLRKEATKMPPNLGELRRIHLDLCKAVTLLDKDISCLFASMFTSGIFISCFCLYQTLNGALDALSLGMNVFWIVGMVAIVGVMATFAACVNEAAHAPLDCIFDIGVDDPGSDRRVELNLFLTKLTGTQVGFTVLGLITITKEFLLTISSVFLTYFVLLYTL